jgi:hypothetical protein
MQKRGICPFFCPRFEHLLPELKNIDLLHCPSIYTN